MRTFFVWVMVIIALVFAGIGIVFASSQNPLLAKHLTTILIIHQFFELMIPVLGAAALINYLWKSCSCCCKGHHE